MDLTEKRIDGKTIFRNGFLEISEDRVLLPNGNTAGRIVARHPGAVCVLAVTDDGKVVFVRQWRYATGGALLELPAGKTDIPGEAPEACALRELAEETPYTAKSVTLLQRFYTAPGFCNEIMSVYLAEGVHADSTLHNDADEFTETVLMSREEVIAALRDQTFQDAKTILALQCWLLRQTGCSSEK